MESVPLKEADFWRYVGQEIRRYRLEEGLRQADLASRVGYAENSIGLLERGTNDAHPTGYMLYKIAFALRCDVVDFFPPMGGTDVV